MQITQYDFNQNSTSRWNKSRMEDFILFIFFWKKDFITIPEKKAPPKSNFFINKLKFTNVSYKLELLEQEQSVITIYLPIDSFKS